MTDAKKWTIYNAAFDGGKDMAAMHVLTLQCGFAKPDGQLCRRHVGDVVVTSSGERITEARFRTGSRSGTSAFVIDTATAPRKARCKDGHPRVIEPETLRDVIASGKRRHAV